MVQVVQNVQVVKEEETMEVKNFEDLGDLERCATAYESDLSNDEGW